MKSKLFLSLLVVILPITMFAQKLTVGTYFIKGYDATTQELARITFNANGTVYIRGNELKAYGGRIEYGSLDQDEFFSKDYRDIIVHEAKGTYKVKDGVITITWQPNSIVFRCNPGDYQWVLLSELSAKDRALFNEAIQKLKTQHFKRTSTWYVESDSKVSSKNNPYSWVIK